MSTVTERKKSVDRAIDGAYPEFAQEVRHLLGWEDNSTRQYFSSRKASGITGVGHVTITTMARGFRPSFENIRMFADALHGDSQLLLKLCGYLTPVETGDQQVYTMNATTEREKAALRPIDGRYDEMAKEVRKLLGWGSCEDYPFLTTRSAARKTGISHTAISSMARGDRPSENIIMRFAQAMDADETKLLSLSGYGVCLSPWIAISDQLPDPNEVVLVREVWGGVPRFFTAYLDVNGFWGSVGNFAFDGAAITHWMPIPAVDEALTKRAAERQGATT